MRFAGFASLVLLLSVSLVSAGPVPSGDDVPMEVVFSRGLYQCDDDDINYYWNADWAGEGFANQFSVFGGGIAQIDTLWLTIRGEGPATQTIMLGVWDDAGGAPGAPLFLEFLDLTPYNPGPGYYTWLAVVMDVVVEDDFWIGYLDDGSMSYQCYLDDSGGCNTWFYDPNAAAWIDIDDHPLGVPAGLSLFFRAWASEGVPVELVSFEANAQDGAVVLEWSTATEQNNFGYYVLRSLIETDGYAKISDIIRGAGTSAEPHSYSHTDSDVAPGIRYFYQLVDVDTAGNESQHGPVNVRLTPADASSWGQIKAEFE